MLDNEKECFELKNKSLQDCKWRKIKESEP